MPNAADEAADYAITHGFKILRVAAGMRQDALAVLTDLETELVGIVSKSDPLKLNDSKHAKLLADAQGTIADAYKLISKEHGKGIDALTTIEWQASNKMVNQAVGVDLFSGAIPPKLLEAVSQAPVVLGHSSKDWWMGQDASMRQTFQAEMAKGILIGETNSQLVKRIRGAGILATPDPTAPKGIMAKARRDAEALVLTSASSVANHARIESFKAKPNLIKGIVWLATLDNRTTLICMALDGKMWSLPDFKPIGHNKVFPGSTAHWRCRSTQTAVLYSWSELAGKKLKELDDQTLQAAVDKKLAASGMSQAQQEAARVRTRASMDGQVGKANTYGDWAAKKGKDFLNQTLGPGRAELYNNGQISFSDLTDQNNRPITLKQLEESVASGNPPPQTNTNTFPTAPTPKKFADVEAAAAALAKAQQAEKDAAAAEKIAGHSKAGINVNLAAASKQVLKTGAPHTEETLNKIEALAAEKKATAAKISTLAGAKKKFLAGEPFTAAQQAVWDSLEYTEAAAYSDDWSAIKAGKASLAAAEQAKQAAEQAAAAAAKKAAADLAAAKQKAADDLAYQKASEAAAAAQHKAELAAAKKAQPKAAKATKAGTAPAPKAKEAVKPVAPVANEATPAPDKLTFVRSLGGSTGAELHKDAAGNLYVVKKGNSPDHIREEATADDIYRALGVDVPPGTLHETANGPVKVTKYVQGAVTLAEALADPARAAAVKAALQEDFATDILLGNWDVAGLAKDNVLVTPDNKVIRIDNGGALRFRAMGTAKTDAQWNDNPTELFTMRRKPSPDGTALPPDNANHAELFADADWLQISKRIEQMPRAKIAALPMDPALKETVLRRYDELAIIARRTLNQDHDGWKASFAEEQANISMGYKATGVREAIPQKFTVKIAPNGYDLITTADGDTGYGRLRTKTSGNGTGIALNGTPLASDSYFSTVKLAVQNVNYHKNLDSNKINQGKLQAAIDLAPALKKISTNKASTTHEKAMAKQYLGIIEKLKSVKAKGQPVKIATISQYVIPFPKGATQTAKATSIVSEVRNIIKSKHGDAGGRSMDALTEWMRGQASNSWSEEARVAKHWMSQQTADPSAFHWSGNGDYKSSQADTAKVWKKKVAEIAALSNITPAAAEAALNDAFMHWHTMTQDILTWTDMPYNDRERGLVRLVRTETTDAVTAAGTQKTGYQEMQRGPVESHSIFNKTAVKGKANIAFWMAAPHHRVMGTFLTEKSAGSGISGFAGDGENEFASHTSKMPSIHQADDPGKVKESTNAADWGVPLDHTRK